MRLRFILLSLLLVLSPLMLAAQPAKKKGIWPFKINRYDKLNRPHGMWKLYLSENKSLLRKGRYKHGKERGKWYYFYPSGQVRKIEYHKLKEKEFLVQLFHENGQLEKQGMAQVVETPLKVHYYWFGTWQVYDERGQYTHSEYYEKGKEMPLNLTTH